MYMRREGMKLACDDEEAVEAIQSLTIGQSVVVKITRPRNVQFHRKFFALLNAAYHHWEVPKGCEKSRQNFRAEIIMLAGFYRKVWSIKGELRVEPLSISFAKMDQDEFDELYTKAIDAILKHVLTNWDREDIENAVEEVMSFA